MKTLKTVFDDTLRPELIENDFKRKYNNLITDISWYCWRGQKTEAIRSHSFLVGFVSAFNDIGFFDTNEYNNILEQLNKIQRELIDNFNIDEVRLKCNQIILLYLHANSGQ